MAHEEVVVETAPGKKEVDVEAALAHKAKGNEFFLCGNYELAKQQYAMALGASAEKNCDRTDCAVTILFYSGHTWLIEAGCSGLDDRVRAICLTNRCQAEFKLEEYGLALTDANEAIKADKTYTKAYYRRALTYTALLQPKNALKDYRSLVRMAPGQQEFKLHLQLCERLVKRLDFEKAIALDDPPSAMEGLAIDDMKIDAAYDGAPLGEIITTVFITDMVKRFKSGKKIHQKYVYKILSAFKKIVMAEPTMVELDVLEDQCFTICGDTHGQFFDLLHIFEKNGWPSDKHSYIMNGDFVDRGSWSTEIALLLFAYKWLYPQSMHINRGNHETDDMNKVYGFEGECKTKYNERTFRCFSETFSALPLACLIGKKYLVLHGGLFSDDDITLDSIRKLDRHRRKQPGNEGLMMEMLWTDPQVELGRGPSKRGVGLQFGPDVTKRFCEKNGLKAVIRSHEVRQEGYEIEHNGQLITVFSAPNYCDSQGNMGAYINLGPDLELNYHQFSAVPHPNLPPMAYASELVSSFR